MKRLLPSFLTIMLLAATTATAAWKPGLLGGYVSGAFNKQGQPETMLAYLDPHSATNSSTTGSSIWVNNRTWVYQGQIHLDGGPFFIGEHMWDNTQVKLDGEVVLTGKSYNDFEASACLRYPQGWHEIEIRFGHGGGRGGMPPNNSVKDKEGRPTAFGICKGETKPAGMAACLYTIDPGDMSLFRYDDGCGFGDQLHVRASDERIPSRYFSPAGLQEALAPGDSVACSAAPAVESGVHYRCTGYVLEGRNARGQWIDPVTNLGATAFTYVHGSTDSRLTWLYEKDGYLLDAAVLTAGSGTLVPSLSPDLTEGCYSVDTELSLTATPTAGFVQTGWLGTTGEGPVVQVVMDGPKTIRAVIGSPWTYDPAAKTMTEGNWVLKTTLKGTELTVTGIAAAADKTTLNLRTAVADAEGKGYQVVGINGFTKERELVNLFLPDGLRYIGRTAFRYCTGLVVVEPLIPAGITTLGECCFAGCTNVIGEIVFPPNTIGLEAWWEANETLGAFNGVKVTSADLSAATMKSLPQNVLANCKELEWVKLPKGIQGVPSQAFYGCISLKKVTPFLPETIKSIGSHSFHNCSKLTDTLVLEGTNEISFAAHHQTGAAFRNTGIPEIVITAPVEEISKKAWETTFREMKELRTITMPPTLRYLGQQAFIGCTKLENVFLTGDCLGTFISDAFGGAPDYQVRVFVPRFNASWETFVTTNETIVPMDDALVEKYRAKYPTGSLPIAMWTNGWKHIWFSDKPYDGPNALYIHGTPGKAGADKVSPAYGMQILGTGESVTCTAPAAGTADGAFYRCVGSLLETEVSDHVWGNPVRAEGTTRVVTQEGTETKRLTWLWEPGGYRVETSPYGAGLGHVVLDPPSQIGDNNYEEGTTVTLTAVPDEGHVFRRWFGEDLPEDVATNPVATVVLDSGKTYRPIFSHGWLYDAETKTITDGNWTLNVTVSAETNLATTGVASFENENVVDLSTPVGDQEGSPYRIATVDGFEHFLKLTHVFLPDALTAIGRSAFRSCEELLHVSPLLPPGLEVIGECTFGACYKLEGEVVLPAREITWTYWWEGSDIIRGTFNGTKITSADLSGATMASLPDNMFLNCVKLGALSLPKGLKSIPGSFLQGCESITNVSPFLPETIRSVGSHAFHACGKLQLPLLLQGTNDITFAHHHSTGAAFMGTGIPEITISAPITRISMEDWEHTFRDMTRLHAITFPSTVTNIGAQIFLNDKALKNVYFTGEAPGVFSDSSFNNIPSEQVILFIPRFKESWDAFRAERNVLPPTDEEIDRFHAKHPTVTRKPIGIWEPVAGQKVWLVHWATPEDRKRGTMLLIR